jgi:hypothetical protein
MSLPAAEPFSARIDSPQLSGDATVSIGQDGLSVQTPFDAVDIPFAAIVGVEVADYQVRIMTDSGPYAFGRLGRAMDGFRAAVDEGLRSRVITAFGLSGEPIMSAAGDFSFIEADDEAHGHGPVLLFDTSVCLLPPTRRARRIPLCFVTGLDARDFGMTLHLGPHQRYAVRKMGRDAAPFLHRLESQLRALREAAMATVRTVDPTLSAPEASALARLLPAGAAAPLGRVADAAPGFVAAVGKTLAASRIADTFADLMAMAPDRNAVCLGIRPDFDGAEGSPGAGLLPEAVPAGALESLEALADAVPEVAPTAGPLIWLLVPGSAPGTAALEFAGAADSAAATFLFRYAGEWDAFWPLVSRALEAVSFNRTVLRLTDQELALPAHELDSMAVARTPALAVVRAAMAARVIHSTPDAWRRKVGAFLGAGS